MPHLTLAELTPELDAVLTAARPGHEVRVLVAPPGSGKSRVTQQAVINLIRSGRVKRVLWATRDTTTNLSLGAEAEQVFNQLSHAAGLGDIATRVYGQRQAKVLKLDYRSQFGWSVGAVKVISHAHLKDIFSPLTLGHPLSLADLLVIDEDPLDSLIHSSHPEKGDGLLNLELLRTLPTPGPVIQMLIRLLERAHSGSLTASEDFPTFNRRKGDSRLDDAAFYEALGAFSPADWDQFRLSLGALPEEVRQLHPVKLIGETFQKDVEHHFSHGESSRRFGLRWTMGGTPGQHALRYDLCRPVRFSIPTLVLDGYADQQLYQGMLHGHTVTLTRLGTVVPLKIEFNTSLRLAATSDWSGFEHLQVQHRKQLVEELADLMYDSPPLPGGDPRSVLVLTSKVLAQFGRRWRSELIANLNLLDPALLSRVSSAYWMSGRGRNAFEGHHVLALTRPAKPTVHREHGMAALFPFDPGLRLAAHRHLNQTELLQMLHRGRQPFHPGARIITGFDPELPERYASSQPYKTYKIITPGSKNARSLDAITAHSRELDRLLGGVPRLALQCLELISALNTSPAVIERARRLLREKIQKSHRPDSALPHLRAWASKTYRQYGDVPPSNSSHSRVRQQDEVFSALGLDLHTFEKSGSHGRQVVHALTKARAQKALGALV